MKWSLGERIDFFYKKYIFFNYVIIQNFDQLFWDLLKDLYWTVLYNY